VKPTTPRFNAEKIKDLKYFLKLELSEKPFSNKFKFWKYFFKEPSFLGKSSAVPWTMSTRWVPVWRHWHWRPPSTWPATTLSPTLNLTFSPGFVLICRKTCKISYMFFSKDFFNLGLLFCATGKFWPSPIRAMWPFWPMTRWSNGCSIVSTSLAGGIELFVSP